MMPRRPASSDAKRMSRRRTWKPSPSGWTLASGNRAKFKNSTAVALLTAFFSVNDGSGLKCTSAEFRVECAPGPQRNFQIEERVVRLHDSGPEKRIRRPGKRRHYQRSLPAIVARIEKRHRPLVRERPARDDQRDEHQTDDRSALATVALRLRSNFFEHQAK